MLKFSIAILVSFCFASSAYAGLVVDNFLETGGGGYGLRSTFFSTDSVMAQQFNTGGTDYRLNSISTIIARTTAPASFTVRLWSTSANNTPDIPLVDFTLSNNPAFGQFDTYSFTPDSSVVLDGLSNYFISFRDNLGPTSNLAGSVFGSNNYQGPGNIIENVRRSGDFGVTWGVQNTNAILLQIDATPGTRARHVQHVGNCGLAAWLSSTSQLNFLIEVTASSSDPPTIL